MRDDQIVRIAVALSIAVGYAARTISVGHGEVMFAGLETSALVAFCVFELAIAFPEVIDRLPYLKSNDE